MNRASTRESRVGQWLNDLAALSAGRAPLADSKTKIAALTGLIAQSYDPAVFCQASLVQVARNLTFFPSYAELCDQLDVWWKDHRPRQAELPPTADAWSERVQRERDDAQASWETITPAEIRAKIALVGAMPASPMQKACQAMLASALRKHAAHHLGLLPPAWLDPATEGGSTGGARTAVQARHLTPEQVAAERARIEEMAHV